jgi:hypothetical protein
MPTLEDFKVAQPFCWHPDLQNILPILAKDLLAQQQATFRKHWSLVSAAFPDLSQQRYLHSWFLAGTRSFYYVTPEMEKYPVMDRLALMPVADIFNHAETGCDVSFGPEGFTVSTDRTYRAGEEICISYGEHSDDFLLAEYGFLLAENRWDMVCIDDVVLPALKPSQAAELRRQGVFGPFLLDPNGIPCHKTRVALELVGRGSQQMQDDNSSAASGELFSRLLCDNFAAKALAEVRKLTVGEDCQKQALEQRWKQIAATISRVA